MKNLIQRLPTIAASITVVIVVNTSAAAEPFPKLEKLAPDLSSKSTQAGTSSSIAFDTSNDKTSATENNRTAAHRRQLT